ncbi:MBL fold metallo-hydrolase [Ferrimonas pelagia]|uniref:MBL fold metallo-hydrolase n=1 Tax=Ferrimonas pelagia TaxID=1177826 RepID=A0ABP9EJ61_9GAMM
MPIRERFQHGAISAIRVGRFAFGINTTFILYRIDDTLIDTGPNNQWASVRPFIDEDPVRQVLLTHHHEDHSGNAARIAQHCDLLPYAPPQCQAKLAQGFATPLLQRMIWGKPVGVKTQPWPEVLQLSDGAQIIPVHTPGHAKDLHCFHIPAHGVLFTGDLYIARSIRFLRSDEDLSLIISSIRHVLTLEFDTLLCAHSGVISQGKEKLAQKLDYILDLCERAQALHAQGLDTDQIVPHLLGNEGIASRLSGYNFSKRNLIQQALRVPLAQLSETVEG